MATVLSITPTRVIFSGGKFDSENRYLRSGNASANIPITQGMTFWIALNASPQSTYWRYSVNGYVVETGGVSGNASFTLVTS